MEPPWPGASSEGWPCSPGRRLRAPSSPRPGSGRGRWPRSSTSTSGPPSQRPRLGQGFRISLLSLVQQLHNSHNDLVMVQLLHAVHTWQEPPGEEVDGGEGGGAQGDHHRPGHPPILHGHLHRQLVAPTFATALFYNSASTLYFLLACLLFHPYHVPTSCPRLRPSLTALELVGRLRTSTIRRRLMKQPPLLLD